MKKKLEEIAIEKGFVNPALCEIDGVISFWADDFDVVDIGFSTKEAIQNLSDLKDVFGGKIIVPPFRANVLTMLKQLNLNKVDKTVAEINENVKVMLQYGGWYICVDGSPVFGFILHETKDYGHNGFHWRLAWFLLNS